MMSEAVMVRLLVAATVKIAAIAITNSNSKKKKKQSVHLLNMLSRSQLSPPPTAILKSQRPSTLTM